AATGWAPDRDRHGDADGAAAGTAGQPTGRCDGCPLRCRRRREPALRPDRHDGGSARGAGHRRGARCAPRLRRGAAARRSVERRRSLHRRSPVLRVRPSARANARGRWPRADQHPFRAVKRPLPAVAVVGRPNVGKSTFFNRVLGERRAIVEDIPGVTRDRNFARAEWAGRHFYIIDTGGLETEGDEPMTAAIRRQVMAAIEESDVVVFVVDGRDGPQPLDHRIADVLHRSGRPVILVVNKMDRLPAELGHHDFWELGLGEPLPVSAISGKGSGDVLDAIVARLPEAPEVAEDEALHVAVVGKPNVGKSSFINRLLGEDRLVVSEVAGTTRDAVDTPLRYHGRTLVFVDTAGLRRRPRIEPGLEYYSALRTERAIERADVCLLLVDATEPVHVQDLK